MLFRSLQNRCSCARIVWRLARSVTTDHRVTGAMTRCAAWVCADRDTSLPIGVIGKRCVPSDRAMATRRRRTTTKQCVPVLRRSQRACRCRCTSLVLCSGMHSLK